MTCRLSPRCVPRTLGQALECAIKHGPTPMKAIADAIDVQYHYLKSAADPHRDDTQFQLRLLVPLLRATGDLSLLRFLAAEVGCAVVELPSCLPSDDEVFRQLALVVQELGEGSAETQRAFADGRVTPAEAAAAHRQIDDLIEAALRWKALIASRVGRPAPARMTLDTRTSVRVSA